MKYFFTFSLVAPLLAFIGQVRADTAQDIFDMSLAELLLVEVSSADKMNTAIRDIPASVSIISRSEIQRYGYKTLPDLLQNVPGLYLTSNVESVFIGSRGNANGRMQLLVNGVPQHPSLIKSLASTDHNQFNIPVGSIDRVEVIRGPMSVIYGNNAFLGVINIVTNDTASGSLVSASAGTSENGELFGRYSQNGDQSYFVANIGAYRNEGLNAKYEDMMTAEDFDALAPGFEQNLHNQHNQMSIDLSAGYKDMVGSFRYQKMHYGFYPISPGYGDNNDLELETYHAALSYETQVSEKTRFRSSAIYSQERYSLDELRAVQPNLLGEQSQTSRRADLELNMIHSLDELELIGGYRIRFMSDITNRARVHIDETPIINFKDSLNDHLNNEVFSQARFTINNKQKLVAGARVTEVPSITYRSENVTEQEATTSPSILDDDNVVNWRLAWIYSFGPENTLRVMAGTAAYDNDLVEAGKSEKIRTYEVNYLGSHKHWKYSVSLFNNELADISERTLNTVTLRDSITTNGEWQTLGLETIVTYRPPGKFRYSLSTLLQTTKDIKLDVDVGYSPKTLVKFKSDYLNGPFSLGLNINYVDSMKTAFVVDENGSDMRLGQEVPEYVLFDVNMRYRMTSRAYVNLKICNLLDETVRYAANEVTENLDRGLIGMGRVMTVGAELEF